MRAALAALLLLAAGPTSAAALAGKEEPEAGGEGPDLNELTHVRMSEAGEETCHAFVEGEDRDGGHHAIRPACGVTMSTNCAVTYKPMVCPDSCPFIAPSQTFPCLFTCVTHDGCSDANPDLALADHATMLCTSCSLVGCKECGARDRCNACHEDFVLQADGSSCLVGVESGALTIVRIVGVLVVALAVTALVWGCVGKENPFIENNMHSIMRSRRHRRQTKVLKWDLESKKQPAVRYPISVNVHQENICGMGLALFYNSICFTIFVALLLVGVTQLIYNSSGDLALFDLGSDDLLASGIHPESGSPAVVVSRLQVCPQLTSAASVIAKVCHLNFYGMCFLYVTLFLSLIKHTLMQKRSGAEFDAANATMSDYVLRVTDLPEDAVDEVKLRAMFEGAMRKAIPGKFARPPRVKDGGCVDPDPVETVAPSQIEVAGVSICYDYRERHDDVNNMVQIALNMEELSNSEKARATGATDRTLTYEHFSQGEKGLRGQVSEHREKVQAWFKDGSETPMKSSGTAFVVFKYIVDRERVSEYYDRNKEFLRHPAVAKPLELHEVEGEPASMLWWHCGFTQKQITNNLVKAVLTIFCYILAIQLFVILPYAVFFLWPFTRIGSKAGGLSMTIMGIVIGIINGQLGGKIWGLSAGVGFHRKESQDTLVLMLNVLVSLISNTLNFFIAGYSEVRKSDDKGLTLSTVFQQPTIAQVGLEFKLGKAMYNLFMPGMFFIGFLTTIVMAGAWPFILNTFLMKVIYIWRALPPALLGVLRPILPWAPDGLDDYPFWRAEKALEPMEIQIGDYANLIMLPFLCSVSLLFLSPYSPRLHQMLFAWGVFYYVYERYMHLRFCKKCYYTRPTIDNFTNLLWGLPLSVVAVAAVFWGYRSHFFGVGWPVWAKTAVIVATFAVSMAAWMASYWYGVNPMERINASETSAYAKLDVFEQQANLVYSWFNCNPVFVLKCKYLHQEPDGGWARGFDPESHPIACGMDPKLVRTYMVGKEYLFLKAERQSTAFVESDPMEIETYIEVLLGWCGRLRSSCSRSASAKEPKDEETNLLKVTPEE